MLMAPRTFDSERARGLLRYGAHLPGLLLAGIAVAGCAPDRTWFANPPIYLFDDAGDVPIHVSSDPRVFTHCRQPSDCPTGACLLSYPGGLCTRPCSSDAMCTTEGMCASGFCLPRCGATSARCESLGSGCARLDVDRSICAPTCGAFPASAPCATGLLCDQERGECAATLHTGALVGSTCTNDAACAGLCLQDTGTVHYTNGYCVAVTVRPTDDEFVPGAALPTQGCPPAGAILPLAGEVAGDYTYCWFRCTRDFDCRAGYRCDHQGVAPAPFADGVCRPAG